MRDLQRTRFLWGYWPFLIVLLGGNIALDAGSALAAEKTDAPSYSLKGDVVPIHDPVIIRQGDTWYVFATNHFRGKLLPIFCSKDLTEWKFCGNVFDGVPEWALKEVPGAKGIWAPDIAYVGGRYRLYYSVSTFGSNRSVIGLATNKTLDMKSPDYRWVDEGEVVGSGPGDFWNAIDANFAVDKEGRHWLSWGSFWGGIKMRRLDPRTGKLSTEDTKLYSLAHRPDPPHALEAPFIVRKGKYYYLFLSFDLCCRGKESTYNIRVGRSEKITGPYKDRDGTPMMEGGGTLLLEGNDRWKGPGHPSVLLDARKDLLVFHAYDGRTGAPFLHITPITWKDGWPSVGPLPGPEADAKKQPDEGSGE